MRTEELLPDVYSELRRLAASYLRRNANNSRTLQPTALVHEAYLKLSDHGPWQSRAHFLGTAALAMRHFLSRYRDSKKALKRDAGFAVQLDDQLMPAGSGSVVDSLLLEELLQRLEQFSPQVCRAVEARFFGARPSRKLQTF